MILLSSFPPTSALEMVVPAQAVGKVMGKGGTNLENIRKVGSLLYIQFFLLDLIV